MYTANSYVIRRATNADDEVLDRLAALDSQRPLEGAVLIGELDGEPAAALSLADGRTIADPFRPTAHLVASMHVRARGVQAVAQKPSLRDRLIAGLPASYRARLAGGAA